MYLKKKEIRGEWDSRADLVDRGWRSLRTLNSEPIWRACRGCEEVPFWAIGRHENGIAVADTLPMYEEA